MTQNADHLEEMPDRRRSCVTQQPGALHIRIYLLKVNMYDTAQVQILPHQYSHNGDYYNALRDGKILRKHRFSGLHYTFLTGQENSYSLGRFLIMRVEARIAKSLFKEKRIISELRFSLIRESLWRFLTLTNECTFGKD